MATTEEQLKQKYQQIKSLNEEIPGELAKKIRLYGEALLLIGKLHAAAHYGFGKAYSDRKRAWGAALVQTKGTQADKNGTAEVVAAEWREIEAKAEAEMLEWKNAFAATEEIIQAMKLELKVMLKEMGIDT